MNEIFSGSRRSFMKASAYLSGTFFLPGALLGSSSCSKKNKVPVFAHIWVYASAFPPHWDSTPVLEKMFSDLSYAGIDGVELMEVNLKNEQGVSKLKEMISKYDLPVSGTSYHTIYPMWESSNHPAIMDEFTLVADRLTDVGGKTFGISVGDAGHAKTEEELDAQAEVLLKMLKVCEERNLLPNLHNHTYEVTNNLHDLKGTLERIPEIKLGPDVNWLIRAGVDPVDFINTYGDKIVYLHLRDQYADGTWTEYLGQGATDFSAICKALERQNFNGQAAIELAFPDNFELSNPLKEDWKLSRKFVKKTFGW